MIESGSSSTQGVLIKSHHNLVRRPNDFPFTPFEPLRDFGLFKDQVRSVGKACGVPASICNRHPFPGPGLSVRVAGVFSSERLDIARAADAIYIEELAAAGCYDAISQAGAVVLSDKSVCVQGDSRHYGWTVMLWAYVTEDFMTADVYELSPALLLHIASRISREVPGVGRVGFNYTTKPPGTIEWE